MELAAAGVGSSYGNSRYQEEQQQHQVQVQVAPFVAKTYQMVDDPSTDWLIRWGKARNSFLVLDPVRFSQLLLPTYFKHANFSSFVRQLNTYGFRKVDFDRWEFAHESFLQGQTHLLRAITRRKKHGPLPRRASSHLADADTITNELVPAIDIDRTTSTAAAHHHHGTTAMVVTGEADLFGYDDKEEKLLLRELSRLKREQRELDAELVRMSRRLHDTEGRPQQMMALLTRAIEDPDVLSRLMVARDKYTDVVNRTPLEAQQHRPAADSDHTTPPCHWKPAAPPSGITTSLEARYYGVWDSGVPHAEEYGAPPTQLSAASFDRARVHLDGNYYVTTAVPPLGVTATAPGFDRNQLSSEAHFPASTQAFDLPSFPLDLSHNITTQTHHSISPIPNQSLLLPSFPLDLSHNRLYHQ